MSFLALLRARRPLVIIVTCLGLVAGFVLGARIYPQGLAASAPTDVTQKVYVREVGTASTLVPDQLAVDLANLGDVDGGLGEQTTGIWFQTVIEESRFITVKVRAADEDEARADLSTIEQALSDKAVELGGEGASVEVEGMVEVDSGAAALASARLTFVAYPVLGAFLGFCIASAGLLIRRGSREGA